jgi:choline dehydrogenase-like flavoprotein
MLWLFLFGVGTAVMFAAQWIAAGKAVYESSPVLAGTLAGQMLLFLTSFYLFSGIRDNELCALVLTWFKLVSATVMLLLLLSSAPLEGSAWPAVGGALLDYLMGGLTFGLWLAARRSRVERLTTVLDVEPNISEEPVNPAANRLRTVLGVMAGAFGAASLAIAVYGMASKAPQTAVVKIALANAAATWAGLGLHAMLAAEAPIRRTFSRDIVVAVSVFGALVLCLFRFEFLAGSTLATWFLVIAAVHLVAAILVLALNAAAARVERPSAFFGPWLHGVCERFAEVLLTGGIEVVTPREVTDTADQLLAQVASPRLVTIRFALAFIEFGGILRFRTAMSRMGRMEREDYLTNVFERGERFFRSLIKIKQLIFLVYYSDERAYKEVGFVDLTNRPLFQEAEAAGDLPSGPVTYPPDVTASELEADVCVIGSGAGGAVTAARLAEAGKRVVILEEGPYFKRDKITREEGKMQVAAYREGGLQLTLDFGMYVLQGRCVGGSTFLNNGICFDIPDAAFRKWQDFGASLDRARLADAYSRLRRELGIIDLEEKQHLVEKGSLKFMEGCRKMGISSDWFEVNLDGCIGCGYCTLGCAFEKKMSMDRSFIPRALAAGATLVTECKARRIRSQGGEARAVECSRSDGSKLVVRAKQIVVACGAIGSSLLLQKSGITRNVGTRLGFNVGSWVIAEFPDIVDQFDGVQMCAYHDRPRYMLETIAMQPGVFAATMPGFFQDHFARMRRYRHYAIAGALIGSEPVGRVHRSPIPILGKSLSPIDFQLTASDLRKLKDGVAQVSRVYLKAGAVRVMPSTFNPLELVDVDQVAQIEKVVAEADDIAYGSSHPQGGNPMSDDLARGAVDSHFRVHGFDNLFVCDASVFPSPIQANPQLTVMAMADYAAGLIARM